MITRIPSLFLLSTLSAFCSGVNIEVGARFESVKDQRYPDVFFIIDIVNESEKDITIRKLNDQIIDCGIELWKFERGVKLWPKADAERKREQAFILWDKEKIKAGKKKRLVFNLRDLMAGDPDNDDFAHSIKETVASLESGTGRVVLKYNTADEHEETAEGVFDLEKLRKEQKPEVISPDKKPVKQESIEQ